MNLLEYQAKTLLSTHGVPVPRSWLVRQNTPPPEQIVYPVIAKSQVPVGGRGKAGGIVKVESADALASVLDTVFAQAIKGHRPRAILLEEEIGVARELYLSLRLNRDERRLEWLASPKGGVEIEANADTVQIVPFTEPYVEKIAATLGVAPAALAPLLKQLTATFLENDLLLLEINPLIERSDHTLVCADAKILADDNARFRHPELSWPPAEGNPPLPLGGTIGCIANGAGMAMSTMDTIVSQGAKPANFLDIGGGTGEREFVAALKNIMELPGVTSIIVNIFAGISRCDEIARGIIAAHEQLSNLPPLFIRLEGTNRDIAVTLLAEAGITIEPDLRSCIEKAMEIRT